ncbi:permease prefix domain 1-containing protein [Nonomuraea sp. SBT364]|uniref:permease prefix domain 1-containing protein n=1 Tax=Nonomuraea sp. SBT364 TaxID=1580530 RepID=UPI00066C0514|nr:permease prefix domain 1-containing protein [Nonomuraea sp. SBT364]
MRIDDYVTDLGRALSGPSGPKRDMVVEARDSLVDAADAHEAGGADREEAERLAIAEFGAVRDIAPGFQTELTAVAGRRLGLLLFVSVPVTVIMWSMVWRLHPGAVTGYPPPAGWHVFVSRLLDVLQLGTGLYGGAALLALARGLVRPGLVTRSLGVIVWVMLPVTGLLSLVLGQTSPTGAALFLPVVLANLVTSAFWGMQLYCATRCLRLSRPA